MKKILFLPGLLACALFLNAQAFSLSDSATIYKNKDGEMLTREEVMELKKGKFSIQTEMSPDGKKIVTIIPATDSQREAQRKFIEDFRKGLMGRKLADFSFNDADGKPLRRKDLEGKVIVMNFWFTSCKPCIQEMPLLNELVLSYKDKNVIFIAPTFDKDAQVEKFLQKNKFDYRIVSDQTTYIEKLNVTVFPTHIITDKKGIIKEVMIGYHADIKDKLGKAIDAVLE